MTTNNDEKILKEVEKKIKKIKYQHCDGCEADYVCQTCFPMFIETAVKEAIKLAREDEREKIEIKTIPCAGCDMIYTEDGKGGKKDKIYCPECYKKVFEQGKVKEQEKFEKWKTENLDYNRARMIFAIEIGKENEQIRAETLKEVEEMIEQLESACVNKRQGISDDYTLLMDYMSLIREVKAKLQELKQ